MLHEACTHNFIHVVLKLPGKKTRKLWKRKGDTRKRRGGGRRNFGRDGDEILQTSPKTHQKTVWYEFIVL